MTKDITQLLEATNRGVSPFHTVAYGMELLKNAGFEELDIKKVWAIDYGKKYFINVYGTTLVAFKVNNRFDYGQDFRISVAHTDWPCLRIKPNPEVSTGKYAKLNVEVYGGPILNTWLDRPLSVAGRVSLKGETIFNPETRLIDFKRPILTIPNVAIHMNRQVNQGVELNPQIDMLPIVGLLEEGLNKESFFMDLLAKELDVTKEDILDFDLYIYNQELSCMVGANNEFISAPRLDNITSCLACLNGIIHGEREEGIDVIALFDNEECGSQTKQGADSVILSNILEKLVTSMNRSRSQYMDMVMNSFLLSVDVAHAIHPNHGEKCDIKNQITMNDGIAIKMEPNQRYATDSSAVAIIEGICQKHNIPYKKFSNRSDIRGGGTLSSITCSTLPMKTVDIGVPMLAMHSSRELMGSKDQERLNTLLVEFFTEK